MVSEFFEAGGTRVAIELTPGTGGVLQVVVDGEMIFDKSKEGGHPNLDRVKQMKTLVKQKVAALD
jgi:predicted Rdx family selenoprotein